jgi:hypothetical protein
MATDTVPGMTLNSSTPTGMLPTAPRLPLLHQRALGAQMIHPNDQNYPQGFAPLYNAGVQALYNSTDPDEMQGFGPLSYKMAMLNGQRKVYEQGLQNLPPDVARSITMNPQYSEGQAQGDRGQQGIAGGEPYSPTPQIGDIQRLFNQHIQQNAVTSQQLQNRQYLPQIMQLPGFTGFLGGDNI